MNPVFNIKVIDKSNSRVLHIVDVYDAYTLKNAQVVAELERKKVYAHFYKIHGPGYFPAGLKTEVTESNNGRRLLEGSN